MAIVFTISVMFKGSLYVYKGNTLARICHLVFILQPEFSCGKIGLRESEKRIITIIVKSEVKKETDMHTTLRLLGFLCILAIGGCVLLVLMGGTDTLSLIPGLAFVGILFLALAKILERLTYVEFLLRSFPIAGGGRIQTVLGEFKKLGKVEGQAMCVGCRKTVPKTGLYYNEELDAYYHGECLSRDSRNR